jgi:hypothetical protein
MKFGLERLKEAAMEEYMAMKRRSHKNQRDRLTNAERADKYLRDVCPDRNKLVRAFAAAGRAAVARYRRRHGR